jgi:flagellin
LATQRENISAANSRIRDVDVADETVRMTRSQILMQAGVSVMAQANQLPSMALSLIG